MPRIFVSYRRADSAGVTGRISEHLEKAFGQKNVFKDVHDIPLGSDFRKVIHDAVTATNVLLVIIGPQWVAMADQAGRRRLDDPDDFVRIEVEAGLNRKGALVIPVLIGGASMPRPDELPPGLRELAFRHAADVRDDPDFKRDMQRLIEQIRQGPRRDLRRIPSRPTVTGLAVVAALCIVTILGLLLATGVIGGDSGGDDAREAGVTESPGGASELPPNQPPVVAQVRDRRVVAHTSLDVPLTLSDPDGDPVTTSAFSSDPTAVGLDPTSRPDVLTLWGWAEGSATVTVFADDGRGGSAAMSFAVHIVAPLPERPTRSPLHIVQESETLQNIAEHYSLRPEDLLSANPNVDGSSLQAGQVLKLPLFPLPGPLTAVTRVTFQAYSVVRLLAAFDAPLPDVPANLAFSPDGFILAVGPTLVNPITGDTLAEFPSMSGGLAFSPDGTLLAYGRDDGGIVLFDLANNVDLNTLTGHTAAVNAVSFNKRSTLLASGSDDGTARLWDVASGAELNLLQADLGSPVSSVVFNLDGTVLAWASGKVVRLWDAPSGNLFSELELAADGARVVFSPDSSLLVTRDTDNTIEAWRIETATQVYTLQAEGEPGGALAFSPDGDLMAAGGGANAVQLYEPGDGAWLAQLGSALADPASSTQALAFSPDGTLLAALAGGRVYLWGLPAAD